MVTGLCTKIDTGVFKHIQKDFTDMFLWEESETLALEVAAKLDIGIDDVLLTVNYEKYDEISTAKNIMGKNIIISFANLYSLFSDEYRIIVLFIACAYKKSTILWYLCVVCL